MPSRRPGRFRRVEAEMHAKHPDEEARRGCDERGLPAIDTDTAGDDRDRRSDEGGDGVKPGAQHGRDLPD